jgi:hypothetical protein
MTEAPMAERWHRAISDLQCDEREAEDMRQDWTCGLIAAACLAVLPMGQAGAANERSEWLPYEISIAGVGIGNLDLSIRRNAERYSVRAEGSYRVMFWSGAIKGEAEGVIGAAGPAPERFEISNLDDDPSATWIDFDAARGPVRWRRTPPAPPEWSEGRLRLQDDHLTGALDPISALSALALVQGPVAPAALCDREVRVFTGFVVFALELDGVAKAQAGRVACNTRYRALSGHREGSNLVDRLSEPGALTLSFLARPGGAWVPERITILTRVGTLALSMSD